jgi:hypothetical protein
VRVALNPFFSTAVVTTNRFGNHADVGRAEPADDGAAAIARLTSQDMYRHTILLLLSGPTVIGTLIPTSCWLWDPRIWLEA